MAVRAIGDEACSGPGPCAHNGAYRATDLSADQSPTYGAGAYELGFGVVTTVMAVRLSNSILMGFLRMGRDRKHKNCSCEERCGKTSQIDSIHEVDPFGPCNLRSHPSDAADFRCRCTK